MKTRKRDTAGAVLVLAVVMLAAAGTLGQDKVPAAPETPGTARKLDLPALLARAREAAPDVDAARARVTAAEAQLDQAIWAPYSQFSTKTFVTVVPEKHIVTDSRGAVLLESGGHQADNMGLGGGEIGPLIKFELEGGIPIYTFGKISGARHAAEEGVSARKADVERIERELELNVRQAYWGVKLSREILYTIGEGRGHLDKALRLVQEKLDKEEDGFTEVDLLKLKLFAAEVDRRELDGRLGEAKALSAIRFLSGGEESERLDVDDAPLDVVKDKLQTLDWYRYQASLSRPEIRGLRALRNALKAKVEMREAGFYPDFLLAGELGVTWAPLVDDIHNPFLYDPYNSKYWGAGLLIKLDLDFGMDQARLNEARAELAAMSADEKRAVNGLLLEVEQAYLDAQKAEKELAVSMEGRKLAKGWLAAVMQGLAAGVNSTSDLTDALIEYFSISLAMHKAIYDYNTSMAKLLRATGLEDWK